jgi:hypothetical protein
MKKKALVKNDNSFLNKELKSIIIKHKNGEDLLPYLTDLLDKFDGYEKLKIIAEICSYTILFKNNLKAGIEQFVKLIEHPDIVNNDLITVSIFFKMILKIFLFDIICILYIYFFFYVIYVFKFSMIKNYSMHYIVLFINAIMIINL